MNRKNLQTLFLVPLLTILIIAFSAVPGYTNWGQAPGLSADQRPSGPAVVGNISYYADSTYEFEGQCQGNSGTFTGPHDVDLGDTYEARDFVGTQIFIEATELVDPETGETCLPPENAGGISGFPCDPLFPEGDTCYFYQFVVVAAHNLNQDLNDGMSLDIVLMFVVPKGNQ
jgi:hypothetical protein